MAPLTAAERSGLIQYKKDPMREGEVPPDMRDAKIVTLFKNKGDRSDCNNYRGISNSSEHTNLKF